MKKVLLICDGYPPDVSPNGNLLDKIILEVVSKNNVKFDVISLTSDFSIVDKQEGLTSIYRVLTRLGNYKKNIKKNYKKNIIQKIISKIYYKIIDFYGVEGVDNHSKKIYELALTLYKKNRYDCLITLSNPFEIQYIGYRLKTKFPKVFWCAYMMDPNSTNYVQKNTKYDESKILSIANKIIMCPEVSDDITFVEKYKDKLNYLPMPIVKNELLEELNKSPALKYDDKVNFMFSGLFYKDIRNPEFLFTVFEYLPSNYVLHLYSRGCNDIVEKYKIRLKDRLIIHGFVDKKTLARAFADSDIFINIGNTIPNQAPSKFLEYISIGKPIINLFLIDRDTSKPYLEKYPLSINIKQNDNEISNIATELIKFACNNKNKSISFDQATENLEHIRLENVAEKFYTIIGNDSYYL